MFAQSAAAILLKLSRHLALLSCLLILSRSWGRADVGQFWIFIAAATASLLHLAGRAVRMRAASRPSAGSEGG